MQQFLGIGLRVQSVMTVDIGEGMGNRRAFGLLRNDSLLVAVARRVHCEAIATADSALRHDQGVPGLRTFGPGGVTPCTILTTRRGLRSVSARPAPSTVMLRHRALDDLRSMTYCHTWW